MKIFKDKCEYLIKKPDAGKELQLTLLVLSLQEARLPSHCERRFFLTDRIIFRGLN